MVKEMIGGCCVCSDERGWDENPLVYCDGHGCNVAVHQGTGNASSQIFFSLASRFLYRLHFFLLTSLLWDRTSS